MTTREIEGRLKEMYGVDVSPTLISSVTEAVMEEVKAWQNRPLEETYAILYLDALRVKICDGGHVQNKAIYVAIAATWKATRKCWACGLRTMKARNFGCRY
jgi:putative transposase